MKRAFRESHGDLLGLCEARGSLHSQVGGAAASLEACPEELLVASCAAANLATGTRKGEQET